LLTGEGRVKQRWHVHVGTVPPTISSPLDPSFRAEERYMERHMKISGCPVVKTAGALTFAIVSYLIETVVG
jgi:hypothetical protein